MRVVALVAAKDRVDTVAHTVAALLALTEVDSVMVVDDGSTDGTAQVAAAAGARVLILPANRGKGAAVAAGVAALAESDSDSDSDSDLYLLVDADVGATAAGAGALVGPVADGEADMTVGVLPAAGGRGGFGTVCRVARAGIARATGVRVTAPLSGQRCVRADLMRRLDLAPRFGLETALTIDVLREGGRVVEVPVEMDHRHTGRTASGFAHRARQGADIVRALWPRVTTARTRVALIVVALVIGLVASAWSGSRWEPSSVPATATATKVLVVGIPGLVWGDIEAGGAMPNLREMKKSGALAAMSVRTRSHVPSLDEGYASLGAGSRVSARPSQTGVVEPGDGSLVVTQAAELRRRAGRHLPTLPGSLGEALHEAGRRTAVVGDAAVALMDRHGVVDFGIPDPGSIHPDGIDPEGIDPDGRTPVSYLDATQQAMATADVTIVDTSGLDDAGSGDRHEVDEFIGRLAGSVAPTTFILVVSVIPPATVWRLTPVVASGAGVVPGYLHSPSTKRLGLVTLTDVAPTILATLGADVPSDLIGRPWRFHPGTADVGGLARLDRDAAYRERIYFRIALGFILTQAILYGVALAILSRRSRWSVPRRALRIGALSCATFPMATFVFRGIPNVAALGLAGVGVLLATDLALVALALRARRSALSPLAWIMGATMALMVLDVVTGARLQTASIMGYSPHTAARFYGIGNTAFAVLAATSILFAAIHLESAPRRREALVAVGALLVAVLVIDGAPGLGDDVGGILTLTPVFLLAMMMFARRRLTVRVVVTAAVVTGVLVAMAAGFELLRPPEARTHLGRVVADTLRGDGTILTTIARKAEVNVAVLRGSVWTWTVPIIAGFGLLLLIGKQRGARLLPAGSPRRAGVVAALVAGLLGFALNDSGVIVTALVLVLVGPLLIFVALEDQQPGAVVIKPSGPYLGKSAFGAQLSGPQLGGMGSGR